MQKEECRSLYRPRILLYCGRSGTGKTRYALQQCLEAKRSASAQTDHHPLYPQLSYASCDTLLIDDVPSARIFQHFLMQLGIGQNANAARHKRMICGYKKMAQPCDKLARTIIFTTELPAEELLSAGEYVLGGNYVASCVNPNGDGGFNIYDYPFVAGGGLSPQCFQ